MTDQHPITPPPELVQQWTSESLATQNLCNRAARWGADQELEACCEWLDREGWSGESRESSALTRQLRAVRRPKPPSLKEKAYAAIDKIERSGYPTDDLYTLRRALEQLDD